MSANITVIATLGLILVILAFNLNTESVIMRNAGKDMSRIGARAKTVAKSLGGLGVALFIFGSWLSFNPNAIALSPSIVLSLAAMTISPAPMLAIKAYRLTETRPEYLEKSGIALRCWVRGLIVASIILIVVALAFSIKNVVTPI